MKRERDLAKNENIIIEMKVSFTENKILHFSITYLKESVRFKVSNSYQIKYYIEQKVLLI